MNQVALTICNIAVYALAIWKIWDLLFPKKKNKPSVFDSWNQQRNLVRFFGEFTYKVMKGNSVYQPAPKDIYDWLFKSFVEWVNQQNK